jgi:hypothetical protein
MPRGYRYGVNPSRSRNDATHSSARLLVVKMPSNFESLFIEGRGALKRELVMCLRTGRALREPRARSRNKP